VSAACTLVVDGDTLRFGGDLLRDAVPGALASAPADLRAIRRFDLGAVDAIDSAGLALLSLLADRCGGGVAIVGDPAGFSELRRAYRLGHDLTFTRD
jgi:phospholipid transport system transporter-binding protein